jgi:uroporphyrin-III C-methyltransferase
MIQHQYEVKSLNPPKLTLVGAGPGDPDLITVKGIRKIAEADVLMYDALVNTDLLHYAPKRALKILVGKRANRHLYSQESINDLIIRLAKEHGHVVRLKGGDPFIFGRGSEEMSHAVQHQIPVEVIPGISSATGVPATNYLPLTSRGISESFWVITGTTSNGQMSDDIKIAIQSTATVIILMGIRRISEIVEVYMESGKKDTPAMVIQEGTMKDEKRIFGRIEVIESQIEKNNIKPPAVIIIGNVVEQAEKIQTLNEKLKQWQGMESSDNIKGQFSNLKYMNHVR